MQTLLASYSTFGLLIKIRNAFSIDYLTDDLTINWGNSGIKNFISFNASVYSSIVSRTPLIGLISVIGI
jgi:hypothetical protein